MKIYGKGVFNQSEIYRKCLSISVLKALNIIQISKQNRDLGMSENAVTNGLRKHEVMGERRKYIIKSFAICGIEQFILL